MRSPLSGDRARMSRRGDSARGATAPASRASTDRRVTVSRVARNSAPCPSKTRTSAPARRRRTSRAWWAACSGSVEARSGSGLGDVEAGETHGRARIRRAAHSPSDRVSTRPQGRRRPPRRPGRPPPSRPERTRVPPGARRDPISADRARRSGAVMLARTRCEGPGAERRRRRRRGRRQAGRRSAGREPGPIPGPRDRAPPRRRGANREAPRRWRECRFRFPRREADPRACGPLPPLPGPRGRGASSRGCRCRTRVPDPR